MKAILTVTPNPALDVHARVEALVPRQKLRCRDVRRDPGGGGINVARAVKKLGGEAVAGLVLGLAREWSVPEAFDFAVAAGAAALTTGGTELCPRGETERLYEGLWK